MRGLPASTGECTAGVSRCGSHCDTVSLWHSDTVTQCHCYTVSPCHHVTVSLCHCGVVSPPCVTVTLWNLVLNYTEIVYYFNFNVAIVSHSAYLHIFVISVHLTTFFVFFVQLTLYVLINYLQIVSLCLANLAITSDIKFIFKCYWCKTFPSV